METGQPRPSPDTLPRKFNFPLQLNNSMSLQAQTNPALLKTLVTMDPTIDCFMIG